MKILRSFGIAMFVVLMCVNLSSCGGKKNNTEDGQRMRKIVIDWLEQENIIYDKIVFAPEDKLQICLENNIDVMIEDKVANIEKISTRLPVICFHAGYNKHCENDNIYRAYTWYDIYNLINGGKICKIK